MITTNKELNAEFTRIWDTYGAFFAFTQKQFNEKMKEGVQYVSPFSGLICPSQSVEKMQEEMDAAVNEFQAYELETHGKKKLIWRELANHECQISMDYREAFDTLECYGITEEEVFAEWGAYMDYCREHDLF